MDLPIRTDGRVQLLMVGAVGLLLIAMFGRSAPAIPENIDPVVYLDIIHGLRSGEGFHQTVDSVFRGYQMGPVDSVLAVRSPICFWLLALAGSDDVVWVLYLLVVTIAAVTIGSGLDRPAYAIGVQWFFALVGLVAWTAPELWASVLVTLAVGLTLRDRWVEATIVATVATSIRELAILVLVGLLASRLQARSGWWLPAVGIGLCAGLYLWHWEQVSPFLAAEGTGRQAELFGTARFPGSALSMMSNWLPAGFVLGPILFLSAVAWARRHDAVLVVVPVLGLVMAGLVVHRPEWATFVVPLTIALGGDEIHHRVRQRDVAPLPSRVRPTTA